MGRASEAKGSQYWQANYDSQEAAANAMLDSAAVASYFGDALDSNRDFIEKIYLNTLNKTATGVDGTTQDVSGIDYWTGRLDGLTGSKMTRAEMMTSFIRIADSSTTSAGTQFSNRVDVSNTTAQTLAEPPSDYAISLAFNNSGDTGLVVTDNKATITTALSNITSTSKSNINDTLSTLSDFSTYGVSALDSTEHWGENLNELTFSFNTSIPSDYYGYFYSEKLITGWTALNSLQQSAVVSITQELNKLLGITLTQVNSGGLIQFNIVDMEANTSGFSFMPGVDYDYAGDVFLSSDFNTNTEYYGLEAGEWGYSTIVHELGHALGLKHTFEGVVTLPTSLDDTNHSIMSYTSVNSHVPILSFSSTAIYIDYLKIQPDFYSLYDVAALQAIYGVNEKTKIQDDTYTFKYTDYSIQTIWDAGGEDTLDLSNTIGSSTIDLNAGSLNSADEYSLAQVITLHQDTAAQNNKSQHDSWIAETLTDLYNANELYTGKDNLAIATGVVIENITTGSGDDIITDNEVDNTIITSAGNDKIYLGNGGNDYIDGGAGQDSIYLDLLQSEFSITKVSEDFYTITADNFALSFQNIESLYLSNNTFYTPDMLI